MDKISFASGGKDDLIESDDVYGALHIYPSKIIKLCTEQNGMDCYVDFSGKKFHVKNDNRWKLFRGNKNI